MAHARITPYKLNSKNERHLIVYYQHQGTPVRHRTGVTVKDNLFNRKTQLVRSTDPEHSRKNKILKAQLSAIEETIDEFFSENNLLPSSAYVTEKIKSGLTQKREKLEADTVEIYHEFHSEKREEFLSSDKSKASLKDYGSTLSALRDFTKVNGKIRPRNLNDKLWLTRYNNFLASERPTVAGYKFITSPQNDKTRNKRFGTLKTFGNWLVERKYLKSTDVLKQFTVEVVKKPFLTLSLEEISHIQNRTFRSVPEQKAIDMFIVACHTGVRYSDVIRIRKSLVKGGGKEKFLEMSNHKTKEEIVVPLTRKVISILRKYDYNLHQMSDQKVNHYLHKALSSIPEFQEEQVSDVEGNTQPKYKLTTFHTGRRTFITNLVNKSVSVNAIMKMTGHKKIETLQKYINPNYQQIMDNVAIFENL